jgi:hypothetical protein
LTFVFPIVAAQAIPVGVTGDPPLVTRTEATTVEVEPAFGVAADRSRFAARPSRGLLRTARTGFQPWQC